jgi:hypothetical protein
MSTTLTVTDGTTTTGFLVVKRDRIEAFLADRTYLASFPKRDRTAAMRAVLQASKGAAS